VLISKLPKEEAAKTRNQKIEDLLFINTIIIYTDTSVIENNKDIGVGVVIYDYSD
jgi:hypothetical protein